MNFRVASPLRYLFAAVFAAALSITTADAQPASAVETHVSLDRDVFGSSSQAIEAVLEAGRALEAKHQWASVLNHYEEAIRDFPEHAGLQRRYSVAKIRYSLSRRYNDRSFQSAVDTTDPNQAAALLSEVFGKIQSHYVVTPPWRDLVVRATTAVDIALSEPLFLEHNLPAADAIDIAQFRRDAYQALGRRTIRSRHEAESAAIEVVQLARRQLGLSATATLLEMAPAVAGGLDDYSAFLTGDQLRDVYSQIEGNFVGLGVELKGGEQGLEIVHVIPGSPAEKARIRSGDLIIEVDGQSTIGKSTDKAAALLSGPEGSIATLLVATPQQTARRLTVRREHVEVPGIEEAKIVDAEQGVAYLRLPSFQKGTAKELDQAMWDLHGKGMRFLIVDLRGNPGGLLTASVEAADMFIQQGGIVSTKGRNPNEAFDYQAKRAGTWRVPLIVLIDGDSASASEIFAGAIRDHRRGVIIGEKSYGKGSVQGIFPLGTAGMGMRLTTAKFLSPSGREISKVGIQPHIVPRHAAKATEGAYPIHAAAADDVLAAAVREAQSQLTTRVRTQPATGLSQRRPGGTRAVSRAN